MTRALLVRHGQTTANVGGILAGRGEAALTDRGLASARALGARLADIDLAVAVVSPMGRTRATAEALLADRPDVTVEVDDDLAEVDYGEWTGGALSDLANEPLWAQVQHHPASVTFPGGESMAGMSARAVGAVRRWCARAEGNVLVVSHGDVIKAVLADALGLHLDAFQRIVVHPSSLSVVSYGATRPFVERLNDCGDRLDDLRSSPPAHADAVPGGTSGE